MYFLISFTEQSNMLFNPGQGHLSFEMTKSGSFSVAQYLPFSFSLFVFPAFGDAIEAKERYVALLGDSVLGIICQSERVPPLL